MKNERQTRTKNRITGYAWAAILLLAPVGLLAQEEAKDTVADKQEPVGTAERSQAAEQAQAAQPAQPANENSATDNSPFDYQSSEKISEDLSVSFPVDI
jgi:hypothetical protein